MVSGTVMTTALGLGAAPAGAIDFTASPLKDINAIQSGSTPNQITSVGGGVAFYAATTAATGLELFRTDGTPGGTTLVKDIEPGATGSGPKYLTDVGGTLFFTAEDEGGGKELWKSDGTAAGTVQVKDINPGPDGSDPSNLTEVGGTLFFSADDGTTGSELWKSDGTPGGTVAGQGHPAGR